MVGQEVVAFAALDPQVELWRADVSVSIIELDTNGRVLVPELQEIGQLYPPDLLLGLPAAAMLDQHISAVIPALTDRSLHELFVPGTLGQVLEAPTPGAKSDAKRTGGMKSRAGAVCGLQAFLEC
jgi:hypothetical protein